MAHLARLGGQHKTFGFEDTIEDALYVVERNARVTHLPAPSCSAPLQGPYSGPAEARVSHCTTCRPLIRLHGHQRPPPPSFWLLSVRSSC